MIYVSDLGNREVMAANIKYFMTLHGKTRKQMCEDLGFSYTTFSDWVNAKTYPRIDKIEMMANYFNISKADLVERKQKIDLDEIENKKEPDLIVINRAMKKMTPEQKRKMMNILKASFEEEFNED